VDQHVDKATDHGESGKSVEAKDHGPRTMDKAGNDSGDRERDEIAASRAERIRAERFVLWKEQQLRSMRDVETNDVPFRALRSGGLGVMVNTSGRSY
jgi:hypothetical protein